MKWLFRYKLHHVGFWIAYLAFWTWLQMRNYHTPLLWSVWLNIAWVIGQIGIAYPIIYVLLPRLFNKKKYVLFALGVVVLLLLGTSFIAGWMAYWLKDIAPVYTFQYFFPTVLVSNFYAVFLFVAVKAVKEKIQQERRNHLLEKEKTENELMFLKSQINPHFLFNAINSIYVLIKKDPDIAAGTLVRFADMLRYQLYECNTDKIAIEKEIAYLNNYIEIERLRKGNTVVTDYSIGESVKNFSIAPLLIIPIVENAFKYVSSFSDRCNLVSIHVNYRDDTFELKVRNTIDHEVYLPEKLYGGIGLENVKRRLSLIYNGRHTLQTGETGNGEEYTALLTIKV